jgi:hypothetical protein
MTEERLARKTSLEWDLQHLQAFLDEQMPALLDEARKRRDRATEADRRAVEQFPRNVEDVERRLDQGLRVLIGRMDEETAAAMARLGAVLTTIGSSDGGSDGLTLDLREDENTDAAYVAVAATGPSPLAEKGQSGAP